MVLSEVPCYGQHFLIQTDQRVAKMYFLRLFLKSILEPASDPTQKRAGRSSINDSMILCLVLSIRTYNDL